MTIEEMHIAVNLGVQKIASFQADNLLSQEIDHELNTAMEAFIKQRYSPLGNKYRDGFEQSQKRIDDLRALVVDARMKCFYNGTSITGFDVDRAPLPNDYMFLVNAFSDSYYDCTNAITYNTQTLTYNVLKLSLTPPTGYTGWILTGISHGGTPIISNANGMDLEYLLNKQNYDQDFITNIAPAMSDPDLATESSAALAEYSVEELAMSEITPTSDSNTFVLLLTGLLTGDAITTIWTNPIDATQGQEVTYPQPTASNVTYRTYSNAGTQQREKMSYVQHDDLYTLFGDPFNTTSYNKIKYTVQENFIDVHSDNTFFTTFVNVKYIRQPKRMDSVLGVGCELAPHTHTEIVEMSIKSILEAISDPRYNSQSREVLESE
tara:strand:+ start:12205 stop:13338 length:1134 start_codon:yes stop_codon:yes gene_type:complete